MIASSPLVLLSASTLGAGLVWGRWRAVWLLPSVAVLVGAVFIPVAAGGWWWDGGEWGYAVSVFALAAWILIASFALVGVTLRHIPR